MAARWGLYLSSFIYFGISLCARAIAHHLFDCIGHFYRNTKWNNPQLNFRLFPILFLQLSESKDPPLPLDLDVPYNDDFNVYSRKNNNNHSNNKNSRNKPDDTRKNILISDYNSNNEFILRNSTHFNSNNNVLSNTFDNGVHLAGVGGGGGGGSGNNYQNGKYIFNGNSSSRPSHKTHVEIITKNGATKKPNIIGSNYNPETIITRSNFHHHINPATANHIKSRTTTDDGSAAKSLYDRKSTCMLYLQADHTFFQKMGSEEASIEAITRHVQRANSIYKNTGESLFIICAVRISFTLNSSCCVCGV